MQDLYDQPYKIYVLRPLTSFALRGIDIEITFDEKA